MYETPVYNYVLRLTNGDKALAEDLTQEVFLRVFQGLPRFSLRCKFTTWLFQVTKNRVLDELRAKERRPLTPVTLDDAPHLEVLDQPAERVEAIDALWRAIDGLPVDLKMALLLRRRRRPLVQRDRRLPRDHTRHGQVADLQGARGRAGRPRDARASRSPARSAPTRPEQTATNLAAGVAGNQVRVVLQCTSALRGLVRVLFRGELERGFPHRLEVPLLDRECPIHELGHLVLAGPPLSVPRISQWPTSPASAIVRNSKPSSESDA